MSRFGRAGAAGAPEVEDPHGFSNATKSTTANVGQNDVRPFAIVTAIARLTAGVGQPFWADVRLESLTYDRADSAVPLRANSHMSEAQVLNGYPGRHRQGEADLASPPCRKTPFAGVVFGACRDGPGGWSHSVIHYPTRLDVPVESPVLLDSAAAQNT